MVVGEIAEPVDLLVIGGGPGGYAAAIRAAQLGREVVLVERGGARSLGGACLHVGCIPSKALIELADARARLANLEEIGLCVTGIDVDLARFQAHRVSLSERLAGHVAQLLSAYNVRVVEGDARFSKPGRVSVATPDGNILYFELRDVVIAVGTRPTELPGLAVDRTRILDSTGVLALDALPVSLAVVGGGYIGLELGTALGKLGVEVTIVEALDRVLPTLDKSLVAPVVRRLAALGVRVETRARALGLEGGDLAIETVDGRALVPAEKVLIAVGRTPNTDTLGLDVAGVNIGAAGLLEVGADLRLSDHVAAVGDIVAGPALAHKAFHQGIVAAEALSGRTAAFDPAGIPQVVFCDPEVATVGLGEAEAHAAGLDVASFPFTGSGRAATLGVHEGWTRLVVDRATDRVVGTQIVGPHASELIAEGTLAIEMLASPSDLADTIHAHPTLSEGLAEAAQLLAGRPLHLRKQTAPATFAAVSGDIQ